MNDTGVFASFNAKRTSLNEKLESQKLELDAWFRDNDVDVVSISQLALLSGLLEQRKATLAELVRLDDDFIGVLLTQRNQ